MVKQLTLSKSNSKNDDFTAQFAGAFHEIVVPVLEDINAKIESLDNKLSNRLDEVETKLEAKIDSIDRKITNISDYHATRLDNHEGRIKKLETPPHV